MSMLRACANRRMWSLPRSSVVPLNDELALLAGDLSLDHKLPMADAIIIATARLYGAEVVTSDADFNGVRGVTYIPKPQT